MTKAEQIIIYLDLENHPEGGYFKETYRSKEELDFDGIHNISTCIYYLLTKESYSAFHRIRQDEIWHFYEGSSVEMHLINPDGVHSIIKIGRNFRKNQVPQYVVPAGYWFAAVVKGEFALVGCTVSPGFDFKDFEIADRNRLLNDFPTLKNVICKFTR